MSPIPLSALQHWLYCPRQCMLIHLEQAWAENRFTAEGRVLHERAHEGADESRSGVRITRGLPVVSESLGLTGQCDVVEFHRAPTPGAATGTPAFERIFPVEYKRGKPKAHRADEVQLCAQALCLEEMTGFPIPAGALYYGANRRRTEVVFDPELHELTRQTAAAVRAQWEKGTLPPAEYVARKCDPCSLRDHCQPQKPRGAAAWFDRTLKAILSTGTDSAQGTPESPSNLPPVEESPPF